MSDFGEGSTVRARKRHRCEWCQDIIKVGESHSHYKGMWEGDWQDWRTHTDCYEAFHRECADGEMCEGKHQRGRTCDETEQMREEFIIELSEHIRANEPKISEELAVHLARMCLGEVESWEHSERNRVLKASRKYCEIQVAVRKGGTHEKSHL